MRRKRGTNTSPDLFNEGKRIELKVSSAAPTPQRELEPRERIPAALCLQEGQDPGFSFCWVRNAQVLLHPQGSAARGDFAPGEAKPLFFFFLFKIYLVLGNNRKSIAVPTSGVLL